MLVITARYSRNLASEGSEPPRRPKTARVVVPLPLGPAPDADAGAGLLLSGD